MALTVESIEETIEQGMAYWSKECTDSGDVDYKVQCLWRVSALSDLQLWISQQKLQHIIEQKP
jgi:hypothetical protein